MKLFAHGPQDLVDAEHALSAGTEPDLHLLRELAALYGPETVMALEQLLRERS